MYAFHDLNAYEGPVHRMEDDFDHGSDNIERGDDNQGSTPTMDLVTKDSLQRAAALFILKAREGHRIPLSVMNTIIGDFQSLFQLAILAFQQKITTTLAEAGTADDDISSAMMHLSERSPLTNLFSGLQTQSQQLAYFRRHFGLVVSIVIIRRALKCW